MKLIKGNSFTDERGTLHFVNDFHFEWIKRFYTISHPDTSVIRAWQGHKIETKHFFVTKGTFLICWVEIDNWDNPGKELKINKKILSADSPQILIVPPGNANGFKALEPESTLVVFSDLTLEESAGDIYRFESDYWVCEV
jgi:dTDP-4-dehydrorhamnose 3,5-epimerase-like enzyme